MASNTSQSNVRSARFATECFRDTDGRWDSGERTIVSDWGFTAAAGFRTGVDRTRVSRA